MIVQAVAVEIAMQPAFEFKVNEASIFSSNHWVDAAQAGIHRVHFTTQVAKGIDVVHGSFCHQQARHFLEIGLAAEVGIRPLTIARAQAKADAVQIAQ